MGMVVFCGMLIATFLAVLLVPVLFVTVEKIIGGKHTAPSDDRAVPAATHHGAGA